MSDINESGEKSFASPQEEQADPKQPQLDTTKSLVPGAAQDSTNPAVKKEDAIPLEQLGDYQLLECIGRGGMGIVYRARQLKLNRIVALKTIRSGELADDADVQRFHAEAQAAASLRHPNIVQVHEVGEIKGRHFFSMDFVPGQSLAELIHEQPMSCSDAAKCLEKAARAIHYAHTAGIVHRDIKPGNVLIDSGGEPQVTDFGLAKRIESNADLTATGQVLGTPSYMPPEQISGPSGVGFHSDVYSLGALLYAMLTGAPPFRAQNTAATLLQVLNDEPLPPRLQNRSIDRDLETICLKCLEKEPGKRFESALQLAEELRRYLDGRPIRARPIGTAARGWRWCRRNPLAASLIAAMIGVLLLGSATSAAFGIHATWSAAEARQSSEQAKVQKKRADDKAIEAMRSAKTAQNNAKLAEQSASTARSEQRRAERGEALARRNLYFSQMRLAQQAWQAGDIALVLRLLDRQTPAPGEDDMRDWEWHYLKSLCRSEEASINIAEPLRECAFNGDGSLLAVAQESGRVSIWNVAERKQLKILEGHINSVFDISWSPDGKELACIDERGTLTVWNVADGKEARFQPAHKRGVSLAWSPAGDVIATAGFSEEFAGIADKIRLWDAATLKTAGVLELDAEGDAGAYELAFNHSGSQLAAAGGNRLQSWNVESKRTLARVRSQGFAFVSARPGVAFTPDGRRIAFSDSNGVATIVEAENGAQYRTLRTEQGDISALAFGPGGNILATAGYDRIIRLWNIERGEQLLALRGHQRTISGLAWNRKTGILASSSRDGTVKLWNPQTPQECLTLSVFDQILAGYRISQPTSLAWSPTGKQLLCADSMFSIALWDLETEKVVWTHPGGNRAQWHPESNWFAIAARNSLELFDPQTYEKKDKVGDMHLQTWACTPDGKFLAAGDGKKFKVWEIESGEAVDEIAVEHLSSTDLAVSRDARFVAAGGPRNTVAVWDRQEGKTASLQHADIPISLQWNHQHLLAVGDWSGEIRCWSLPKGEKQQSMQAHLGPVSSLSWNPRGTRLASVSGRWLVKPGVGFNTLAYPESDRVVKIWDVAGGEEVFTLRGHTSSVYGVAWSPDGNSIASCGKDMTVRIWGMNAE